MVEIIPTPETQTLTFTGGTDKPYLTIKADGTIEIGEGLSADEATQAAAKMLVEHYAALASSQWPNGTHVEIAHDGFKGDVIGHYTTREGKRGVVLQQEGTRVVHVYGEKWLALPMADIKA